MSTKQSDIQSINIDTLSDEVSFDLLQKLCNRFDIWGKQVQLPSMSNVIVLRGLVNPGEHATVRVCLTKPFKAYGLLLAETVAERKVTTVIEKGWLWWRTKTIKTSYRSERIPIGVWTISEIYADSILHFAQVSPCFPGSAFSTTEQVNPLPPMPCGSTFTLHVKHNQSDTLPFVALLYGKGLE